MSAIFGERLIFGQQKGSSVELKVFGDEFYARYESMDGYTVVYDLDLGQYCYAYLQDGYFASTGKPLHKPCPNGIRKHLKEAPEVRREKFNTKYKLIRPDINPLGANSNVMRTYGPNSGLLNGRQASRGEVRGITIMVDFEDVQTNISRNEIDELLNGENYSKHGNYCSVMEYFREMSNDKLQFTNRVIGPVQLSHKRSYYINNSLIEEAFELAMEQYDIDLSEFDSIGDGIVDAISFMYAGRTKYAGYLWPHNHYKLMHHGNMRTHFYTIQSLGRNNIDLSIGTFVHECGHMLCRFPDLYDYGQRDNDFEKSGGLGDYCLMSSGNHLNGGKTPSPICAYLRDLAGWCVNQINLNNQGEYKAIHGDYGTVMKYKTNKSHEYFIVENRFNTNLDTYLPDAGLAVYHCDTRGSNEYQDGTPDNHYQCALIQADGHRDLENSLNRGDEGDLFNRHEGVALSNESVPDSREWDGTDSKFRLGNISTAQRIISFHVGVDKRANRVCKKAVADMIIPDYTNKPITSTLWIENEGKVNNIRVGVDIKHTYRGDLVVNLEAPSGKTVLLHSNKGGALNNLMIDVSTENFEALKALNGESVQGEWKLHVMDTLKDDVGRLDNWWINIDYMPVGETVREEIAPSLQIPDEDVRGKLSPIFVKNYGSVKSLAVEVDISHEYAGDLQIELISPSGEHALLHPSNGDNQRNIKDTYTEDSTASLKALVGEEINGNWMLHVRDLVPQDEGVLNRWAITFET